MNVEDIRKLLNSDGKQFKIIVNTFVQFILEKNRKAIIANYIVGRARETNKMHPANLFKFFFERTRYIVKGTKLCNSLYAEQMMLKSIWEQSRLQLLVVRMLKNNLLLRIDNPEEIKSKVKHRKGPETPEERKQRLKRQAALMRQAKARKNKKIKNITKAINKPVKHIQTKRSVPQKPKSKFSKAQLEQIELLKHMKI